MSPALIRWQSRLWWLLPVVGLGILLGVELGWGRQVHRLPEPPSAIEARPVTPALLPEYTVAGGLAGHAETVNRTLFNPTRRPAPAAVVDAGRTQMKTGQFVLTGTSLSGDRSIAFLKEVAGGKFRSVRKGEQINGMLVAEVKVDRVRLTQGGDSEELVLKVAPGPKMTAAPLPANAAAPGAPNAAGAQAAGQPPIRSEEARLAEMRRRAAEAATAAEVNPPAVNVPSRNALVPQPGAATAGQGTPASADPGWNEVYERMRQRGAPSK